MPPFEASIAALHLDLTDKANSLIKESIKRMPEDHILIAVHAIYLLIAGNFPKAICSVL
jgi:hypothetical protein